MLLAIGAACVGNAAAQASPAVSVTSMHPVTVVGRGFLAGERVRVVLYTKRIAARTVVASRTGRFVVRYPIALGDCTGVRVVAKGNRGSRASYAIALTCESPPR